MVCEAFASTWVRISNVAFIAVPKRDNINSESDAVILGPGHHPFPMQNRTIWQLHVKCQVSSLIETTHDTTGTDDILL
ncbi:MAG: hypothetical protein JWM36_1918 [Hyphomicrobiales bacterium]|nr:hypothetical protein [Hyphomicrobiales bacterium]